MDDMEQNLPQLLFHIVHRLPPQFFGQGLCLGGFEKFPDRLLELSVVPLGGLLHGVVQPLALLLLYERNELTACIGFGQFHDFGKIHGGFRKLWHDTTS